MRTQLLFLALLMFCPSLASSMTMDEAVQTAIDNNPKVLQYSALEKASHYRSKIAESPFWPSLKASYRYSDSKDLNGYASDKQSSTLATARYNLFNGSSDWFQKNAADQRAVAAGDLLSSTIADVALEAKRAFINQLRAERTLETEEQAVKLLERQLRNSDLRFKEGLIARNDQLRVEVELASARQKLLQAQGAVTIAKATLTLALGEHPEADELLDDFDGIPEELQLSEDELLKELFSSRSELSYLNNRLQAEISGRKSVRGDLLPEVDVVLSHEEFGNGSFPENNDADYRRDSRATIEASWTLFNGFETRYELASRKHELDALRSEILSTKNRLALQLRAAIQDYMVARGNLETARIAVTQAEENYRVNENRFQANVAATVDLLDAQELLTRTRNEQVKALYDLHLSEAVLDRVLER